MLTFPETGFTQNNDNHGKNSIQNPKKLHITADSLVANQKSQYVVFSGNVVALYELTTINSDKLHVYYLAQDNEEQYKEESIEKIIASGNVQIDLEGKNATCDHAIYITSTNSLILTGDAPRVQSENSYITGKKITIYQNSGQIIVDGGVEVLFHPEEKNSITDLK